MEVGPVLSGCGRCRRESYDGGRRRDEFGGGGGECEFWRLNLKWGICECESEKVAERWEVLVVES